VPPLTRSSWSLSFEGFHCPNCGGREAFRSRPRGFFERYVLAVFMQPVRCERCYRRSYAPCTIAVPERPANVRGPNDSLSGITEGSRIA